MTWRIAVRILAVVLGAVNAGLAILLSQGQGVLSQEAALLVAVLSAMFSFALAALPSAAGLSSLEPKREETVALEHEIAGKVRGMNIGRSQGPHYQRETP